MQITKPGVLALILTTSACASNEWQWEPPKAPKEPLRGGIAEFQVTSYDGETIKGRVLLGATIDPFVIDGRLIEPADVELTNFRACDKKDPLAHIVICAVVWKPRPDEIITVRPGYWYGKNVKFWPFYKPGTGLGPDCLEAELIVRAFDGREVGRLPIHVVRTDKPSPLPEGGAPAAPKPPPTDAGAP